MTPNHLYHSGTPTGLESEFGCHGSSLETLESDSRARAWIGSGSGGRVWSRTSERLESESGGKAWSEMAQSRRRLSSPTQPQTHCSPLCPRPPADSPPGILDKVKLRTRPDHLFPRPGPAEPDSGARDEGEAQNKLKQRVAVNVGSRPAFIRL